MAIEAQLPDGTTLHFPDGTPPAIVDGAVKQHVSSLPGGAVETRESRLGFTPAPTEPSKSTIDFANRPMGEQPSAGELGLSLPTSPSFGGLGRIATAAREGYEASTPDVTPGRLMSPVNYTLAQVPGVLGGMLRGAQQAVVEATPDVHLPSLPPGVSIPLGGNRSISGELTPGSLGREVAALPEAFPTGAGDLRPPGRPPIPGTEARIPLTDQRVPFMHGAPLGEAPPALVGGPYEQFGQYGPSPPPPPAPPAPPPFVPPGMPMPPLNRLLELIRADEATAANKPAFIPPTTSTSVTGEVAPIQQPRNPLGPEPRPVQPPAPPDEPPAPGPAGAQVTPPSVAGLTPEQAAAAGSTADKQWFYKSPTPGEVNDIEYIQGINPTMAQREQTVNAAREIKTVRGLTREGEQAERELLIDHSNKRKSEFQDLAGSDVTQQADMKAANDQIEAGLQAAYARGGTVDLQPVINAANAELTGSAGKLPALKAAMKEITDAAQKSDGSGLETDPRQANAVRRVTLYLQSKEGRLTNPGYGSPDVMAAVTRVKDVLTKQIEPAAPGFTEANTNYAKARQAIEAREALQAAEPKLYGGPFNTMQFGPMKRLMGDIIASRDPNAPLNPYKALTEDQMNRLKSLHDDLQRVQTAEELARVAGSDTTQRLSDLARRAVQHGAGAAAGTVAGLGATALFGPHIGVPTGMFVKGAADYLFSTRAEAQATREMNRLLRPDVTQFPLKPNTLMQPPETP